MASIPEPLNQYLSKIFGLRLITRADFNFFFNTLKETRAVVQSRAYFDYLPRNDETQDRVAEILKLLTPKAAREARKIRLGNANDGGYICLDSFENMTSAVSLGISDDVSWDLDVAAHGVKIYQYDHTVEGPPVQHPQFNFHKIKVATQDAPQAATLDSIVSKNHITAPGSSFLKMDIEGDEWDVFLSTSDETLDKFSQIVCELHNLNLIVSDDFFRKVIQTLKKLTQKFEVTHIHGNNYAPLLIATGSHTIPQVIEVSFANRKLFSFSESRERLPGPLDAPCNPACIDYEIDQSSA